MRSIRALLIVAGLVLISCSTGSRPSGTGHDFDALIGRALREPNPQVRWRAILNLAGTAGKARIVDALRPGLDDGNAAVRWNAVVALSFFDAAEVVPMLNAAATGAEPLRRWEAINSLGRVWNEESIERLGVVLRSPSIRDRSEVVLTLGRIGEAGVDLLISALGDESAEVRWRTAMALGKTRDRRALPALRVAAVEDADSRVRAQAQKAIEQIEPREIPGSTRHAR